MRTTLLDRMSATRLALAHRRVAEAIEALGSATDHDELAHHWLAAGVEDQGVHQPRAGRRPRPRGAGLRVGRRAVPGRCSTTTAATPDGDPGARGAGVARARAGPPGAGPARLLRGRRGGRPARARRLGDADLMADAAVASIWPGTFFITAGRDRDRLVELCEDALELLDDGDPRRVADHVDAGGAPDLRPRSRPPRRRCSAEALALAREHRRPRAGRRACSSPSSSPLWDPTTHARRAEIATEVGRMARASGDVDLEFFAGFFAASGATERGDVGRGAARGSPGWTARSTASHNFYFRFLAERLTVSLDILTGRPDVQAAIDDAGRPLRRDPRRHRGHVVAADRRPGLAGGRARRAGRRDARHDRGVRDSRRTGCRPTGWRCCPTATADGAGASSTRFDDPPLDYFWLTTMQSLAELAVALGRVDACKRIYELLVPFRDQLGVTSSGALCFGLAARSLGQLGRGAATSRLRSSCSRMRWLWRTPWARRSRRPPAPGCWARPFGVRRVGHRGAGTDRRGVEDRHGARVRG